MFFYVVLNCMDVEMHKPVEAVFKQEGIMCKSLLPYCDFRSLSRFTVTCKSLQKFSFENICFHMPEGSICLEDFKKLELDCCKSILKRSAMLNNSNSFNCMWNLRCTDLENDLKQLSGLSTLEITPEMAMRAYQENYKELEKKHKADEKKALEKNKKKRAAYCYGLRQKLFYGTAAEITPYFNILGEVDAFDIIPRGSYFVEILFEKDYYPRGERWGYTESVFATVCCYNNVDIVLHLLGKYIDEKPKKAAHYLLEGHYCNLFAQIAEKGRIDINLTDKQGRSALHVVAERDEVGDAIALLQCGALVNALDKKGRTPLHIACKHGALQVIQTLLCCDGIDPHKKDSKKREPKDLLSKKNAMVKLLIEQHDGAKGKK